MYNVNNTYMYNVHRSYNIPQIKLLVPSVGPILILHSRKSDSAICYIMSFLCTWCTKCPFYAETQAVKGKSSTYSNTTHLGITLIACFWCSSWTSKRQITFRSYIWIDWIWSAHCPGLPRAPETGWRRTRWTCRPPPRPASTSRGCPPPPWSTRTSSTTTRWQVAVPTSWLARRLLFSLPLSRGAVQRYFDCFNAWKIS